MAPATLGGREHRRRNYRGPVIVALSMLSLALGIRLPEKVARGPLLTAPGVNTANLASGPGATWS